MGRQKCIVNPLGFAYCILSFVFRKEKTVNCYYYAKVVQYLHDDIQKKDVDLLQDIVPIYMKTKRN